MDNHRFNPVLKTAMPKEATEKSVNKQKLRDEINAQIDEFISGGGMIEVIASQDVGRNYVQKVNHNQNVLGY